MRTGMIALICMALLWSGTARAETLSEGLDQVLSGLDLSAVEEASGQENLKTLVLQLARGDVVWDAQTVLARLRDLLLGEAACACHFMQRGGDAGRAEP